MPSLVHQQPNGRIYIRAFANSQRRDCWQHAQYVQAMLSQLKGSARTASAGAAPKAATSTSDQHATQQLKDAQRSADIQITAQLCKHGLCVSHLGMTVSVASCCLRIADMLMCKQSVCYSGRCCESSSQEGRSCILQMETRALALPRLMPAQHFCTCICPSGFYRHLCFL